MNNIYGAIIGDIVGSIYEVYEMKKYRSGRSESDRKITLDRSTPLFSSDSSFTDDSILTLAIANAINTGTSYKDNLRTFGLQEKDLGLDQYGRSKFGPGFIKWLEDDTHNTSYGNGCAMRISPVGYAFGTLEKTLIEAELATIPTHNCDEAINCAKSVAGAIYLARNGASKKEIEKFASNQLGVNLNYNLDEVRKTYKFSSRSIDSVPQAISCFLQGKDFEDVLRLSISLGGDCDTIAAIACGIAGAYYPIPESIINEAKNFIPEKYQTIIDTFNNNFCNDKSLEK